MHELYNLQSYDNARSYKTRKRPVINIDVNEIWQEIK